MDFQASSTLAPPPPAAPARPVFIVEPPRPMTPGRMAAKALAELVLGGVTLVFALVACFVVLLTFGSYDGGPLTQHDIHQARCGQLALLVVTLWVSAPWLATAARRRPTWQLQALIGLVASLPSVGMLASHLNATDWTPLFVF